MACRFFIHAFGLDPARRRAFTLAEMLVVMAVIVILLTALLPAIKGLSQGLGRRGAVSTRCSAPSTARG